MGSLQTHQVEDWGKFIQEHDIDLHCQECKGEGCLDTGDGCEECGGVGYIEPLWNTIWNTGFHAPHGAQPLPAALSNVFAFEWDGEVWFGLSCCGMDCTPYLAQAWLEMFPDCRWLPDQFTVTGINLRGGYIDACVGKTMARRIHAKIGETIKADRKQLAWLADDLKEARKKLAERSD